MKFYHRFGIGLLFLSLIGYLSYKFSIIAINIVGGFVLYFLLSRFLNFLERKGVSERQAYCILFLTITAGILAFILYVSIPVVEQMQSFSQELPEMVQKLNAAVERHRYFLFAGQIAAKLQQRIESDIGHLFSMAGSIITSILTIPIIAVILLTSRKTLLANIVDKLPNEYFEVTVTMIHDIIAHVQDFVWAKSIETVAMIIIYAAGFYTIGLPHGMFLALIGGLLNIIPYIGPLLTLPLLAIAGLLGGGPKLLILSMTVFAIAHIIDNAVLQTWLVSRLVDVHPFIVVVVTLLGGELWGVFGMIIGIPAFVIAKTMIAGMYDYLSAVQRHEALLEQEKTYKQSHANKQQHNISTNVF